MLLAQLITGSGGYAATVGGTVRVIGSNDVDVISLADIAGKISFDGSFNRGGDFIVLPNAAKTYSIVRASSSITLSDADSSITIPVGSKGTTLQFSDGELVLKFDGQIMIGSQIVTTASAAITTTPSSKTALPAATSASGTLLMAADEPVTVGGNVRVVGTNGSDTVTVADVAGNISFDGSFNRGGDKIVVGKFAENYSAARPNASNVTIGDSDTKLTIPMGSKGSSIQFSNESRTLVYSEGNAYLGNQKLSASAASVNSFENNLKFTEVPNAFVGTLPYIQTSANCFAAVDINQDGYKDIIIAFWQFQPPETFGKEMGDSKTPNKVAIFINKNGNYFVDETSKYLPNGDTLDGASRKIEIVDINADKKIDIIFATNREDGRSGSNFSDMTSYLSAIISDKDNYNVLNFGDKDWYHSVGWGISGGRVFVAGAGFDNRSSLQGGFVAEGRDLTESITFPFQLSPNAFSFFSSKGVTDTDLMIQTQMFPNLLGIEGWKLSNGIWISAGKIDNTFEFVKNIEFITYSGDKMKDVPVYKFDNYFILGGGGFAITESSLIDLNNDGNLSVLMKMEIPIINEFDIQSTNIVDQRDLSSITYGTKLIAVSIIDGNIKNMEIKISGEKIERINASILNVNDFNKDGFDDIILSHFSSTGFPIIYINDKNGNFSKISINFSDIFEYHNEAAAGIFEDFNNDGLLDLITIPTSANDSAKGLSMVDYNYYIASSSYTFG